MYFSKKFCSSIKTVSAAVSVYVRDKNLYSLHALSQKFSFYTFHDNSVHTDGHS